MPKDSDDPIDAPSGADPRDRTDTASAPASERETGQLQDDQAGSPALDDPEIDRESVKLLPGTGDYTDDGDVDVDPGEIHMPRLPNRADSRPGRD